MGVCHLFQQEHDRTIGCESADLHHLSSHYHYGVWNLSIMFHSWTIRKKAIWLKQTSHLDIPPQQNPFAHQRGSTEVVERIPSEICSLLYARSRRISPKAVMKYRSCIVSKLTLQCTYPLIFGILCTVKMFVAVRSTEWCWKHGCVHELKSTKFWPVQRPKDKLHSLYFFSLPSSSFQICIKISLALGTSLSLSTGHEKLLCRLDQITHECLNRPKMALDLKDRKCYRGNNNNNKIYYRNGNLTTKNTVK